MAYGFYSHLKPDVGKVLESWLESGSITSIPGKNGLKIKANRLVLIAFGCLKANTKRVNGL